MLWVHATLVESSLAAYERFVARLTARDREQYYREMAVMAELFGVPHSVIPRTYGEFREYFAAQLASEAITVTPPARAVAAVILASPLPAPLRVLVPAHRLSTACLLPPRLRDEYGLRWSPLHRLALPVASRSVRYGTRPALTVASRIRFAS
jgi:uncharacterized protein (DUF2236 family)